MRTQQVIINNKPVNVNEKKVVELKVIIAQLSDEFNIIAKVNNAADLTSVINDVFGVKLITIFPDLNQEDIDNAYPSEIEELVGAFVDVNFIGIKRVVTPIFGLISKGLSKLSN